MLKSFSNVLFKFESTRLIMVDLVKSIPDYFWVVPASSTGKYHPNYALGEGGLYRHTMAAYDLLLHICKVSDFTDEEVDLMCIAILMHDTRKSGSQTEYEMDPHTKFEHPLLAAEQVRLLKGGRHNDESLEFIAHCIESHMGQWNTSKYSEIKLPLPTDKYQNAVHLADYLASRKEIEIKF